MDDSWIFDGYIELLREREERKRNIAASKGWSQSRVVNDTEFLTLWGAGLKISRRIGYSGEGAHVDAYDIRLPELRRSIESGSLVTVDAKTLQAGTGATERDDLVLTRVFNKWLADKYSHLMETDIGVKKVSVEGEGEALVKEAPKKLSKAERKTVVGLIKVMERLNFRDDRASLKGKDLLGYLEELIRDKYGDDIPTYSDFERTMSLNGCKISQKTISKYFKVLGV